jgi:hypothetical protein
MAFEPIWDRARSDLMIPTRRGDFDPFLWEHAGRVAQSAMKIARLAAVRSHGPDEAAILAAALYHDAGWIARLRSREIDRMEVLTRPAPPSHREQSALLMEEGLGSLLSATSLAKAGRAIRTLNDRGIDFIEGQVVTEAVNLNEFGLLSLWPAIRRGALDGKGVQAVIDTWRRRNEYRFWSARLSDSFRFARVREIARKRLESLERFMRDLTEQHTSSDIASPGAASLPSPAAQDSRSKPST